MTCHCHGNFPSEEIWEELRVHWEWEEAEHFAAVEVV